MTSAGTRVMLVCSGNTCRSPMAEAILQRLVDRDGPDGVTVESAGTAAFEGAPASEGAYLVALEQGLDLSAHRARLLTPDRVAAADLILVMSERHRAQVQALGGAATVMRLADYGQSTAGAGDIADPFGGGVEVYRATFDQLSGLLASAHRRLLAEADRDRR